MSLMRFEAGAGSSKGRWLIKELPGVALIRHKSGKWKIYVGLGIITPNTESQEKAWGMKWTQESDRKYMRISGEKYRTLNDAMCALDQLRQGEVETESSLIDLLP